MNPGVEVQKFDVLAMDSGDNEQVWMVSDPTDLRMISDKDAETLRALIGAGDKEFFSNLLRARAQLIASQYFPGVWETRTPNSTEVRIIVQDLTGPFFNMDASSAFRCVASAIARAGQWENFCEAFPQTAMALHGCQ